MTNNPNKKKADKLCDLSIILFIIALLFVSILAASTAKLDDIRQIIAASFAALFFAASMLVMYISIRLYDGEEEKKDEL